MKYILFCRFLYHVLKCSRPNLNENTFNDAGYSQNSIYSSRLCTSISNKPKLISYVYLHTLYSRTDWRARICTYSRYYYSLSLPYFYQSVPETYRLYLACTYWSYNVTANYIGSLQEITPNTTAWILYVLPMAFFVVVENFWKIIKKSNTYIRI